MYGAAGLASTGHNLHITVEAADSLGARASASGVVRVVPFEPPPGEVLRTAAEDIIADLTSEGDVEAVGQLVAALAASLNAVLPEEAHAAEAERRLEQAAAAEALRVERAAAAVRLQAERDAVGAAEAALLGGAAWLGGGAARLVAEWEAEDARVEAEQAAADAAEAERQRLDEERRQAVELEAATRTRDVLMSALLANPPSPPPCTAAADGRACQNSGIVLGTEGECGCECAGTGFGGSNCQNEVLCTAGANGNACENGGIVFGTRGCACDCVGTGFSGTNCQIPMPCAKGADGSGAIACRNSGRPTGTGLNCGCDCAETGFSGTHCTMSAEVVGRASQRLGQLTAKPEQLSSASIDKALGFVAAFDVHTLDEDAIGDLANAMSNLLEAAAHQFTGVEDVLAAERRRAAEDAEARRLAEEREAAVMCQQAERDAEIAAMDVTDLAGRDVWEVKAEWEAEDLRILEEQTAEDARRQTEAAEAERLLKEEEAKARAAQLEAVVNLMASSLASRWV